MAANEGAVNQDGEKTHLGVVVVGHVDAGKSTTTGHLLFKMGIMDEREREKLMQEAADAGMGSFAFAYFMDKSPEERGRGVTILCTTKEFFTPNFHYTIIDAPGHRDFIKNMLSGASQADVALLMVPSDGNFLKAIAKGNRKTGEVQGQTRQHARLCNLLGIKQIIVGINKMDSETANYQESRYEEIKAEVARMLKQVGYDPKNTPFIPMSGFKGDNLDTKSENMPWWNGYKCKVKTADGSKTVEGNTLCEALDTYVQIPIRPIDKHFRMPVSGMLNITGAGDICTGRIEQGVLNKGATIKFTGYPDITARAFSIEMHHRQVDSAQAGDNVGVCVKGLPKEKVQKPRVGSVMFVDGDGEPCMKVEQFTATIFVADHPGQLKCSDKDDRGGFTPSVHIRTAKAPCRLMAINWRKGKKTNKQKIENPPFVESGDTAEVVFKPKKPLYVEAYADCEGLGRVAVMDSNSLIMLGRVSSVEYATTS